MQHEEEEEYNASSPSEEEDRSRCHDGTGDIKRSLAFYLSRRKK